jgi:hypothetical protein
LHKYNWESIGDTARPIKFDELDHKIFQLKITKPSITDSEIGKIVGLSRQNVNLRRNRVQFKERIEHFFKAPIDKVRAMVEDAIRVLGRSLLSEDEGIRLKAAKLILVSEGVIKEKLSIEGNSQQIIMISMPSENKELMIGPKELVEGNYGRQRGQREDQRLGSGNAEAQYVIGEANKDHKEPREGADDVQREDA